MAMLLAACVLTGCKDRGESAKQELKDSGYDLTPEAFFRAAESDDLSAMEKLVKGGIAVGTKNAAGDTALHAAAVAGMKKSADFLLDRKVPVDVSGAGGRTPLMSAVLSGSPVMVRYLLSQKADPLKKDAEGFKPLMLAAQTGHVEAVEMLIEIGANRFSMDDEGRIAADMASEAGHEQLAMRLAEAPGREEFGIEEPADLGAEMLAKVAAAEAEGEASTEPGTAGSAAAVTVVDGPVPLDGMVLESATEGAMPAKQPLVMRAYRQKELPLRVESVAGEIATLRMSSGGVKQVAQGEVIPGTPLKVVRVERRIRDLKDQGGQTEVSVVEVEDEGSGRRRELVSGLESTAHDPVALVEDAGGKRYVARAGQKFRGADGSEYVVIDVRPNQMVIENKTAGEVITAPLRGPRG